MTVDGNGTAEGLGETVVVVGRTIVVVAATEVVAGDFAGASTELSEEHPAVSATTAKIAAAEPLMKRDGFIVLAASPGKDQLVLCGEASARFD
ncbi:MULTISPECIES: hypothetical protein [unclassified Rhodococcus (in: high G+C Gram-positive bacteria)]|uniref:hypothetical protein n=1 Tax=unclassified Rhodococcus (in: high G+C Gram-positive bacteria) TaxID=192944 RepID=UPI0014460CC4|nr:MULTISPECIES: hypothetical protein [unclassified Rhodococcus (in: high G+C Gram-positive bacteria)]